MRNAMENERRTDQKTGMGLEETRLSDILSASQIKATDTYETPPQIIWIDNSTIATLGNFSASTGKAKSKKTFNVSALVAASLAGKQVLNYRICRKANAGSCMSIPSRAAIIVTRCWNVFCVWPGFLPQQTARTLISSACGSILRQSV